MSKYSYFPLNHIGMPASGPRRLDSGRLGSARVARFIEGRLLGTSRLDSTSLKKLIDSFDRKNWIKLHRCKMNSSTFVLFVWLLDDFLQPIFRGGFFKGSGALSERFDLEYAQVALTQHFARFAFDWKIVPLPGMIHSHYTSKWYWSRNGGSVEMPILQEPTKSTNLNQLNYEETKGNGN